MNTSTYAQEIIDVVDVNWQEIELNYKKYEVASIMFKHFFKKRNYRLIIMREKTNTNQMNLFTKDNMKYRTILINE